MNFNVETELSKANVRILSFESRVDALLCKLEASERKISALAAENKALKSKVEELTVINRKLTDDNAHLRKRLKIDSSNSNMPSSTNIFNRPTISNRDKSDKNSGGQSGHGGSTLKFSSTPTDRVDHKPKFCEYCNEELSSFNLVDTRQVHDVAIQVKITNHYIYEGVCSCGCKAVLNSSKNIPHGVSYGSNIKGIVLSLHNKDLIPTNRLSELSEDIFGLAISEGTIYNWQSEASNNLNHYEDELVKRLLAEETLHADESGLRVKSKNNWLHVISSKNFTYYDVQAKRGMEAMLETGVLPQYTGNLMHDCFKSYHQLPQIKKHGLCNAHLLRELKSMDQFYKVGFANKMRDLLLEMNTKVKAKSLSYQVKLEYKSKFKKLIELAEQEALTLEHEKWKNDVRALANRLREHGDKYLAFLDNLEIPFTNNQAEQDIRMIKTKQKISGGFRTDAYAKHFVKIRGFISTMRKLGHNVTDSLSRIIVDYEDYSLSPSG